MEGPSAAWMRHPHAHGADLAMPLGAGVEQYQGPTNYGGNTTSGANINLTPDFAGGWQPSLRPDYDITPDALGLGSTSYDPNFPTTAQTWAPANIRRSLSHNHGRSSPFASGSSMYQAKSATDLLPRSSTAPPVGMRSPGGSSSGGAVGERCRWGGQCQTIIVDLTASGINRHLKECHLQPWDDRSRGYCQWEGTTCSKKLLYYFGFGKHIASVHLRSTASRCELCGQVLARGDTLDRHVKRFCHGRPPGQ
ncbi:hypothetical protein DAEQUDRAFT_209241 [Daedalea quercina L-15889]|uniref:C2H2-type domain-containing protein n=1 Tax=Daedalea quercina L-15889 TaxID=1314783 RepID=A0A165R9T7_9APHY|nr:hypothetical protein DAEQUDRAFT_209241 [Daedalea quercina L-15889]